MILCLLPFSFKIGSGDGLSRNYIYVLFPILSLLYKKKMYNINNSIQIYLFIYLFIYLLALLYQFQYFEYFSRRIISFLLFISIFSFTLIDIDENTIKSFKVAVIITAIFFSIKSILLFIILGGSSLGYEAKDLVGGQRYGFVILLAFWVQYYHKTKFKTFKFLTQIILLIGLILTFSRASLVSLIFTFFFYLIFSVIKRKDKNYLNLFLNFLQLIFIISFIIIALSLFFPQINTFFYDRLFSFFGDDGLEKMDLDNINGSEGYRIFMFKKIMNYVLVNPFTGSGFLGVWILFEDKSGSSHNQYTDVFFRTGFFGLFIYGLILYKITLLLYAKYYNLFIGFLAILIYGLFHETFKESHGAFILTFFIGLLASDKKNKKITSVI